MTRVLIHIGFPKAGSSYLQQWFSAHPRLYYKNHGIAGFYHSHDIARYAESTEPIHDCFVLSSEDLSAWKGDVDIVGIRSSKIYDVKEYHAKLSETLHRIYPQAKLLIVTRGYTTYFNSLYSQYVSSGGVLHWNEFESKFSTFFPVVYDYSYLVNLYRKVFGAENIILLPYELLREDPAKFTSLIEAELGLKENFVFSTEKVNAAFSKRVLAAYFKISNLLVKLVSPLPYAWQKKIYGFYVYKLNQQRPHPFMEFVSRFMRKDLEMNGVENILASLAGKAEILRNEKLFEPYLHEYLL